MTHSTLSSFRDRKLARTDLRPSVPDTTLQQAAMNPNCPFRRHGIERDSSTNENLKQINISLTASISAYLQLSCHEIKVLIASIQIYRIKSIREIRSGNENAGLSFFRSVDVPFRGSGSNQAERPQVHDTGPKTFPGCLQRTEPAGNECPHSD